MPVIKYRSLDDAADDLQGDPADPLYWKQVAWVLRMASRLAPRQYPRGIHRYRSIAEAEAQREQWDLEGHSTGEPV